MRSSSHTFAFALFLLPIFPVARAGDFSKVPGVVIAHSPQSTGIYLGSPAIAILPNGICVAKCDEFGPNSTETTSGVTRVFRSDDHGQTWRQIATVDGLYWANLFYHLNALYMIGVSKTFGDALICKSTDEGASWTRPVDEKHGLLRHGRFHTSSTAVVVHAGRIWRAMETFDDTATDMWHGHRPVMLWAPMDADLLDTRSWRFSAPAARDPTWLGGEWNTWLEGNAVVSPAGKIVDLLRCDYRKGGHEKAMWIDVDADGQKLHFDPASGFIDLPGGCKKFNVRYDENSHLYWSLTNYVPAKHWKGNPERARNTSVLMCSKDLRRWEARRAVLYGADIDHNGFQYADFAFDGADLAAAYRTACDDGMGGAHNQHDSNLITSSRIAHFRTLTPRDSVEAWLAEELEQYNAQARQ